MTVMAPRTPLLAALAALAAAGLVACASPTPTPGATGDGPIVAFYGDSYTRGTGASDPSLRWSTRISESRGWQEVNPSVDGLGFINNRQLFGDGDLPSMIIDAEPDIVFVTMGLNDNFSFAFAADSIETQIDTDLQRLTDALPEARFVVVEPFWYTAERPPSVDTIIGWARDAAEWYGVDYIPGASTWIQGREGEMASDGLHPNDDGYAEMTRRMDEALLELGL